MTSFAITLLTHHFNCSPCAVDLANPVQFTSLNLRKADSSPFLAHNHFFSGSSLEKL